MFESEFEEKQYELRREKLREIGALGVAQGLTLAEATYPNSYAATATIPEIRAKYIETATPVTGEEFEANRVDVAVAGRVMQIACRERPDSRSCSRAASGCRFTSARMRSAIHSSPSTSSSTWATTLASRGLYL